ncbi:MAG: DegV family protein [Oscillospiraceae bacterium]|nr:DegV family protein [Oscillospiraceae bacterium]
MSDYVLSCCSTADLTKEHFDSREIHYICFHFAIDGQEYSDDLGLSVPFDEFYDRMKKGADTRTSQVNISEYVDYFSAFMERGLDIVHVCLSSGLSGTINSARNAALIVKERYPERSIYIVDSLGASSGYGLIMDTAATKRDEGLSAAELAKWIEDNRLRMHHWFFSTDLSSYVRGGRISKTAAIFGGLLEICPLLNMDNEGHLIPRFKIRTKKKVIQAIVKKMEENADDGLDYSGKCYISNSACYDDARQVAEQIEARFPRLNGRVEINHVGTTIGAHTGPGTVALFFWGKERVD